MDTGLLVTMVVAAVVQILFPLGLGLYIARRWRVPWKFFLYGALVYMVSRELTWSPLLKMLQSTIAGWLPLSSWYKYGWVLVLALTAGLFEEGGRYLGYRFLWKNEDKTWPRALMYGAGHGGVVLILVIAVGMLLRVYDIIYVFQVDLATLTAEQADLVTQFRAEVALTSWWLPLVEILVPLLSMALQVALSVLVLQVFTRGQSYWWWLAVGYNTLSNLVLLLVVDGVNTLLPRWAAALVTAAAALPFALFGLWLIWRLRPKDTGELLPAAAG